MPTISELSDVLDWEAVTVLRAIDEHEGAGVDALVESTGLDRSQVENRCQQLSTLGLATETETEDGPIHELTGSGHGAVGSGLYDEYDLIGETEIDELAEKVAELLDRRDELQAKVEQLGDDASQLKTRAERQFGDREDVSEEFESLLADVEALERSLSDEF
jgi:FtsZ-binding cell division protein ZapB